MSDPTKHEILTGDIIVAGGWEFEVDELVFSEFVDRARNRRGARLQLVLSEPVIEDPDETAPRLEGPGIGEPGPMAKGEM